MKWSLRVKFNSSGYSTGNNNSESNVKLLGFYERNFQGLGLGLCLCKGLVVFRLPLFSRRIFILLLWVLVTRGGGSARSVVSVVCGVCGGWFLWFLLVVFPVSFLWFLPV